MKDYYLVIATTLDNNTKALLINKYTGELHLTRILGNNLSSVFFKNFIEMCKEV